MLNKRQCVNCGLPRSYAPFLKNTCIDFDENGKCTYCRFFQMNRSIYELIYKKGRHEFEKIIKKRSGKSRYDAIVLFTGGKDSSYTLYLLVKEYNLNVLALTWDNGFFSNETISNIDTLVNELDVDHKYIRPDWNILKEIYRNRLFNYGRFCACLPLTMLFCSPDLYEAKAPLLFVSFSYGQFISGAENMASIYELSNESSALLRGIVHNTETLEVRALLSTFLYYALMLDLLVGKYSSEVLNKLKYYVKKINSLLIGDNYRSKLVFPSLYFDWDTKTMIETIMNYGWRRPSSVSGDGHTSCIFEPMKGYLSYKQDTINYDILELSTELRTMRITRDKFNRELIHIGYTDVEPSIFEEFINKLEISREEFYDIISKNLLRRKTIPEINENTFNFFELGISVKEMKNQLQRVYESQIIV